MSHPIPLLISDNIWKKGISDSFQTYILSKIIAATHTFSFKIMTYLKKFIGIKSLNRKQCPEGLSPRILPSPSVSPFLPKDNKIKWFWLIIAGYEGRSSLLDCC